MMCTIVIRDVVTVLIFDIVALLIRGADTFVGNDSANSKRISTDEIRRKIKYETKNSLHQFQAARKLDNRNDDDDG